MHIPYAFLKYSLDLEYDEQMNTLYVFLKYSIDLEYDEQMITNYQTFFHFSYSLKSVFPDSFMKIFSRFFSWRIFFVPFRKMVPFER